MTTTATQRTPITLIADETQKLLNWADSVQQSDETILNKAKTLATHLGAHYRADGLTEIGFWSPELAADMFQPKNIYLEVLTPLNNIDPTLPSQKIKFHREHLQLEKQGEYFWGVISGMRPGTKDQIGSFYWLKYLDFQNEIQTIGDVLAYSLPYGVYAPAELYDLNSLQEKRSDLNYLGQGDKDESGIIRVHPPRNIALRTHVRTFIEGSIHSIL